VATQDNILQKRFRGRPQYLVNYFRFVAGELREIMSSLGLRTIDEMIGRADLLEENRDIIPVKAKGIDYSGILYKPDLPEDVGRYCNSRQDSGLGSVLDKRLIKMCEDALQKTNY
jgi:hypothetical protein